MILLCGDYHFRLIITIGNSNTNYVHMQIKKRTFFKLLSYIRIYGLVDINPSMYGVL